MFLFDILILTFGFLSCPLLCAVANNVSSSLGITHDWFNSMFFFLNKKRKLLLEDTCQASFGCYFECTAKSLSDCEHAKITYWPEHVIIMKQLLMFFHGVGGNGLIKTSRS